MTWLMVFLAKLSTRLLTLLEAVSSKLGYGAAHDRDDRVYQSSRISGSPLFPFSHFTSMV